MTNHRSLRMTAQRSNVQKVQQRTFQALNHAAVEFKQLKAGASDVGSNWVSCGAYEDAMKQGRQTFKMPDDVPLNKETNCTRAKNPSQNLLLPILALFHTWLQLRPTC